MLNRDRLCWGFVSSFTSLSESVWAGFVRAEPRQWEAHSLTRSAGSTSTFRCGLPETLLGRKKKKKKRVFDTVVLDHQALLLPRSTRHPQFVPGCPVLPCLLPAVCGVRQMPFGVCIQRCGGRCWMARGSASLPCLHHGQRTVSARSPRPACPHLSVATRFPFPPRSPAGPQLTSYFLIARKWLIPPGLVSMAVQIPRLWPLTSFSFGG